MLSLVQGPAGSGRSRTALDRLAGLPEGLTVVVDPAGGWTEAMSAAVDGPLIVLGSPVARSEDLDGVIRVLAASNPGLRVLVDDVEQTCLSPRRWTALAVAMLACGGALVLVTPEMSSRYDRVTALSSPLSGRRRALFPVAC